MTNGERLILRVAMKPIPTLARPLASVDLRDHSAVDAGKERTDSCAVPAAADDGWGDGARIRALAAALSAEDAQLFYQVAINGRRDMGLAADPRSAMEGMLQLMKKWETNEALLQGLTGD